MEIKCKEDKRVLKLKISRMFQLLLAGIDEDVGSEKKPLCCYSKFNAFMRSFDKRYAKILLYVLLKINIQNYKQVFGE